jgi:hypothetical protein
MAASFATINRFINMFNNLSACSFVFRQTSPHIYAVPRILAPWNRLKAICLHMTSMRFFMILVNLARKSIIMQMAQTKVLLNNVRLFREDGCCRAPKPV